MKLINFSIDKDNCALTYNGQYLDVHNNFLFIDFNYSQHTQILELKWTRSHEKWANEIICSFRLVFKNVSFFKTREKDSDTHFADNCSINFIGFSSQEMREDFDSFINNKEAKDSDDLNINFESNRAIKVNSKIVELIEQNEEVVYIPLLNEGTRVFRPLWADKLSENLYALKSFPSYDPEDEELEFKPGSIVICQLQQLSIGQYLVAIQKTN